MFDKEGNILPQGNITPELDNEFMAELLKAEVDKKQNYEFPQEVYDRLDEEFGENNVKFSGRDSLDNYRENSYNLYTATDEYQREVTAQDKHYFARSLAHKTSGMADGDYKVVYIYCYDKVYCFGANGYMKGRIEHSKYVNSYRIKEKSIDEYIKKDNKYRLSPIFDNGSSLFPQLNTDEKIEAVLNDQAEIDQRIYKFPTSQVKYHGKKSSYYEIISSLEFEECNNALLRITERVDLNKINKLIDSIEGISDKRKEFYKTILKQRFEKILLESYNKLKSK